MNNPQFNFDPPRRAYLERNLILDLAEDVKKSASDWHPCVLSNDVIEVYDLDPQMKPTIEKSSSPVSHPSHYNAGKIEVIEAIEDWEMNFHRGNAIKYTARAGKKDPVKEIEDLEKAVWYLNREIECLKASKEGREAVKPNNMVKR